MLCLADMLGRKSALGQTFFFRRWKKHFLLPYKISIFWFAKRRMPLYEPCSFHSTTAVSLPTTPCIKVFFGLGCLTTGKTMSIFRPHCTIRKVSGLRILQRHSSAPIIWDASHSKIYVSHSTIDFLKQTIIRQNITPCDPMKTKECWYSTQLELALLATSSVQGLRQPVTYVTKT